MSRQPEESQTQQTTEKSSIARARCLFGRGTRAVVFLGSKLTTLPPKPKVAPTGRSNHFGAYFTPGLPTQPCMRLNGMRQKQAKTLERGNSRCSSSSLGAPFKTAMISIFGSSLHGELCSQLLTLAKSASYGRQPPLRSGFELSVLGGIIRIIFRNGIVSCTTRWDLSVHAANAITSLSRKLSTFL